MMGRNEGGDRDKERRNEDLYRCSEGGWRVYSWYDRWSRGKVDEKEINFDLDQDCLWLHRIRNLLLAESSVDVVYIACFLVGTTVPRRLLEGFFKKFIIFGVSCARTTLCQIFFSLDSRFVLSWLLSFPTIAQSRVWKTEKRSFIVSLSIALWSLFHILASSASLLVLICPARKYC